MRNDPMVRKIQKLFRMARADSKYAAMIRKYEKLENTFEELPQRMPEEEEDAIRAFVCISEEMNWRMLEIICEKYHLDS